MAFSDEFLYQLQHGNPIEEVMKSYVSVIRRGRNYVCSCPFHSEKTPSCTIYPDTQSFYCFGCGAGGDVITFIMKIENLDYLEAVKLLAERAGIDIPSSDNYEKHSLSKTRILEINRESARFFYSELLADNSKTGLKYFASRRLLPQTIKKYGLGYSPDSWDKLKNHLNSLGFNNDELVSAGVCAQKNGNIFDMFRNRVMFPIIDLRGNIIAFGGRSLDDSLPKYINTSDTPVFKKSRNLFSLNFAKNSPLSTLILAEGYMDVISINQAGFENVVATLGTALTPEQARIMSQYAKNVIIAYDSDGAGQKATQKAINLLGEAGVITHIIKMEGAKDPDEFIKKFGPQRFKMLLDNSEGAVIFQLEKCRQGLDINSEIGKVEALKRSVKVLSQIQNRLERDVYISKVAKDFEFSYDVLKAQVNSELKKAYNIEKKKTWKNIVYSKSSPAYAQNNHLLKEVKAEEGIIAYILRNPDKLEYIFDKISANDFVTDENKKIFSVLYKKIKNNSIFTTSLLSDELNEKEMGKIMGITAKHGDVSLTEQVLDDFINILLDYKSKMQLDAINSDDDLLRLSNMLKNKN